MSPTVRLAGPTDTAADTAPESAQSCDVLVIGGGPAGSTAAALLARQGLQVVMVEKAHHPRFHIGESLLPANAALLEELGLREAVDRIGLRKWGIELVSPHHPHPNHVEFAEAWDKGLQMAWQVRRSVFDELLFRHAAAQGATTLEGCRAQRVQFDDEGATVACVLGDGQARQFRTRYVIDASGRDTLLASQFKTKQKNERHNSAALFGHFRGAQRLAGERQEGNISIFWFEHGWFWFIPLADGTTSVGATCWPYYLKQRRKPLPEFFADTIALCPPLARRLAGATLVDDAVHATGNYAYSASAATGPRHLLLGDAFCFIDPVFSSGVYLAMANAFQAVPVVQATLQQQPLAAALARWRFEAHARRGPRTFAWFIYRMTNPVMRDLFMAPRNLLRAKEAVIGVLAGDVYGQSPLGASLRVFKLVYGVASLLRWRLSLQAQRRRRFNIQDDDGLRNANLSADGH